MENFTEIAKDILEKIPYITIASVTPDGKPWNSPVYAVHDGEYNFIWNSSIESQHSKNISANKEIFIVIYDSTVAEGTGFGVYIQAEAKELSDIKELEDAMKVFWEKKNKGSRPTSDFLSPTLRRMYKAVPKRFFVNDYDKNKPSPDWRQGIKLLK